jgi:hypothetical protein
LRWKTLKTIKQLNEEYKQGGKTLIIRAGQLRGYNPK